MEILARNCPTCGTQMIYKTQQSLRVATVGNKNCKRCASIERMSRPELIQNLRDKNTGANNAMAGRSLQSVWAEKYGAEEAANRLANFKQTMSIATTGANNPMFGVGLPGAWAKQGLSEKDIADKEKQWKAALSEKSKGENNPMYGKAAPKGSGNGWKGTFDGMFFRSLLELNYMHQLVTNNVTFESAETKNHRVNYTFNGASKTYHPDFYLSEECVYVEVKPKKLQTLPINLVKFEALRSTGKTLKIVTEDDVEMLDVTTINDLISAGRLSFTPSTAVKYEQYVITRRG